MNEYSPKNPDHFKPVAGATHKETEYRLNTPESNFDLGQKLFVKRTGAKDLEGGWEVVGRKDGLLTLEKAIMTDDGVQVGTKQYLEADLLELQKSGAELALEKPLLVGAQAVRDELLGLDDEDAPGRFELIDSFVSDVFKDTGEQSVDDLAFATEIFLNRINTPEDQQDGQDPYRLFTRRSGLRDAIRLLSETSGAHELMVSLAVHVEQSGAKERLGSSEVDVRTHIGKSGLAAVGVEAPVVQEVLSRDEYLAKLTEGLAQDDKNALKSAAIAQAAQDRARANGEYDNIGYWKEEERKAESALSDKAYAIRIQYINAFRNY